MTILRSILNVRLLTSWMAQMRIYDLSKPYLYLANYEMFGVTLREKFHMSLLQTSFQEDLVHDLKMLNGQQDCLIFHPWISPMGLLLGKSVPWPFPNRHRVERSHRKGTTSIGSEVTKVVIDSMKKRTHNCIQSGSRHLKNILYKKL